MFGWFKNVNAGGDVTGRDKITNNILPTPTQIDKLNILYSKELNNNHHVDNIIDELEHYSSSRHADRNLSIKLESAGFGYLIDEAEELKELISKTIVKQQNYKSAQKIITFLLADIQSIFNSNIKPRIQNINDDIHVRRIIKEYLEDEISNKLGDNVLEIYNRQIKGMMFFLTGNCHIEWE